MKKTFFIQLITSVALICLIIPRVGQSTCNRISPEAWDSMPEQEQTGFSPFDEDLFDIAPFARCCTWDPSKTSYHPNRVGELNVEDIFHGRDLPANPDGSYIVPVAGNGEKCIGLQWYEYRNLASLSIEFSNNSYIPDAALSRVECWLGESEWQGFWMKLPDEITVSGKQWTIPVRVDVKKTEDQFAKITKHDMMSYFVNPLKVRWIFPSSLQPVQLRSIEAFTKSEYDVVKLSLQSESGKGKGVITLYNGQIIGASSLKNSLKQEWKQAKPLMLDVRYCTSDAMPPSDRTILNIELPSGKFGVAVKDILKNGGVYVPDHGFYVSLADKPLSLKDYQMTKIAGEKTVLERVRQMPDQSFERAMENAHRAVQNQGPLMLSLACDNVKYVVERHGKTWFSDKVGGREERENGTFHFVPEFGATKDCLFSRHLYGDWMPVPVHTFRENNVVYEQMTFVAPSSKERADVNDWLNTAPLFVSKFTIENTSSGETPAKMQVSFKLSEAEPASLKQTANGMMVTGNGKILAFANTSSVRSLKIGNENGCIVVQGNMPAHSKETFVVYIPGWEITVAELPLFRNPDDLLADTEAYWTKILSSSMKVELPGKLLGDLITASQVHCMIAARNEKEGSLVSPWISSDRYGPLESEAQAVINGMSLLGHEEFARRSLDFFINRYNADGLLTTGYTLWGIGWHFWTLGSYYQVYRNSGWLQSVAPKLEKASNWIINQLEKTKRLDSSGKMVPEYGLFPPGVFADWNRFAYMMRPQGEFYAGLNAVAKSLNDINYPGGDRFIEKAEEFKENLFRAYHWSQACSPVVKLSNGTWVPYSPAIIGSFGTVADMYPGEDWHRAWGKDVSAGPHHLVPLGLLNQNDSREIDWIANDLEDNWFLRAGLGEYSLEEVRENWFDLGGFYKVQPYYARITELYACNDDVKPFIRSYFNAVSTLISKENLTFWEHFHNTGGWNKTHETGWFLAQTRTMLVMERGNNELWLAPFVTSHWMKDGMVVGVKQAPTAFGEVDYKITSHVKDGYIEAEVTPPVRKKPDTIVIRLRHPDEKKIKSITVNGKDYRDFDAEKDIVCLKGFDGKKITVRATFD
ncbi:MAG: hypothetical protein A2W90_05215 [Bacteroidetes bacterium GWF2_42_66]|nr:MAG: hypothetical protein A2W89_02625 [Bacteroidetes bacterium GWE2_42_39]OFY46553.1 MAG: hypothetical protein A2W90_05215 [Bacteroidetes bacterium GWF2_42_66]HBL75592.1 hypothetical protein [Prolixibacteraceae bacterium]HCR91038.1 hypothetical protein [Prolixibacteraceae bacterium]HCU62619.1 hypothetical protein [Prolixibacteraceae bacterium]